MNKIPETQLEATQLKRLAAQRRLASRAKRILNIQIGISVLSPLVLPMLVAKFPGNAVWAACFGTILMTLDILCLTPWRNSLKEKSAKILELFDCAVLLLEWREIAVGSRLETIETVEKYAPKDRSENSDSENSDDKESRAWYRIEIGQLPIHLGRFICQRTNCWWSSDLRHRYATWIIAILVILAIVAVSLGIQRDLAIKEFILAVGIPLMPAFVLGMQQCSEHTKSVVLLRMLSTHAENLLKEASKGTKVEESTDASRELQDAIYNHRRTAPLIPTWLYKRDRKVMEKQMQAVAQEMVEDALKSMD